MIILEWINSVIFGPAMLFAVFGVGIFFLIRTRFFYILHPFRTLASLFGTKGERAGGISPFRALCNALAGTLGVGNIVGVATAISAGGAGAVFWMWISGICAMVLKYAEVLLGVKYRQTDGKNAVGGAPYYIRDALKKPRLAVFFAVCLIIASFSIGCSVQSRAVSDAAEITFGVHPALTGGILAVICLAVLIGGLDSVSAFTVRLIPLLTLGFIAMSVCSVVQRIGELPSVMAEIFGSAFRVDSAAGGILGFLTSRAVRYGIARGIASNEAGCGTAPTAHASALTDSPVRQGLWGIIEVAIDTLLLCTLTAFVILLNHTENSGDGIAPVISGFKGFWGEFAPAAVSISIFFFALATLICWSYYGLEAVKFITPGIGWQKLYLAFFCLSVVPMCCMDTAFLWEVSDTVIALMTVINVGVLIARSGEISRDTVVFFDKK
ncbi:MAG: sodium:alanine symporter family protein [Clostridia bacterium]|nr:sodium:alanine symporter family protein [Clostridia bacterium]